MQSYQIEFLRVDRTTGAILVTLQDGPPPEANSWVKDANGVAWVVMGTRGSEVMLRPPPLRGVDVPKGSRLQRCTVPLCA